MYEINESDLKEMREFVICNLCGADSPQHIYKIDSRDLQLNTLWIDGVEHPIHSQESIVRCNECGLVYVNPRLTVPPTMQIYNDEAEALYFDSTRDERTHAYAEIIATLPKWLGKSPEMLLDIGCGDGLLLELGQAVGIKCSGTEIRQSLCRQVRIKLGDSAILSPDISSISPSTYDVVSILNVIEHLTDPQDMLIKIYRLLKPGGLVVIHAPNWGGLPARIQGKRWHQIEPFEHIYYFNAQTLSAMLNQAGFDSIERFSLITSSSIKGKIQRLLMWSNIYVDNGLGIIARRSK